MRRKLAAGNWKMNGIKQDLIEVDAIEVPAGVDVLICPPATLLHRMSAVASTRRIAVGGQDCHAKRSGAHTGDISAAMLADAGARYVIVGHSERRTDHGETDADVRAKAEAALAAGLRPIVCVGETLAEREAGQTIEVVGRQLDGSVPSAKDLVVAYEPVWAIGTGKVPTLAEIAEVHGFLRRRLAERFGPEAADGVRLLYGGSVKPSNAAEIFAVADVDGALVGGASLRANEFQPIIESLVAAY